jgi:hypothetical protein
MAPDIDPDSGLHIQRGDGAVRNVFALIDSSHWNFPQHFWEISCRACPIRSTASSFAETVISSAPITMGYFGRAHSVCFTSEKIGFRCAADEADFVRTCNYFTGKWLNCLSFNLSAAL